MSKILATSATSKNGLLGIYTPVPYRTSRGRYCFKNYNRKGGVYLLHLLQGIYEQTNINKG